LSNVTIQDEDVAADTAHGVPERALTPEPLLAPRRGVGVRADAHRETAKG
jgi:hypothetical protein